MKSLCCVHFVYDVCKWYIIKNEPFDEWWWRFKWSGLFFICLQIMNVYFFRHASGFISMIIKRWKLLRWKTWNSHLPIIWERKLQAFDLEVKVTWFQQFVWEIKFLFREITFLHLNSNVNKMSFDILRNTVLWNYLFCKYEFRSSAFFVIIFDWFRFTPHCSAWYKWIWFLYS